MDPAEYLADPHTAARRGPPAELGCAAKGHLAVQLLADHPGMRQIVSVGPAWARVATTSPVHWLRGGLMPYRRPRDGSELPATRGIALMYNLAMAG